MTVYGTQLLWPLTEYPFAVGMFIIDPVYLPLLLTFLMAQSWRRRAGAAIQQTRVGSRRSGSAWFYRLTSRVSSMARWHASELHHEQKS